MLFLHKNEFLFSFFAVLSLCFSVFHYFYIFIVFYLLSVCKLAFFIIWLWTVCPCYIRKDIPQFQWESYFKWSCLMIQGRKGEESIGSWAGETSCYRSRRSDQPKDKQRSTSALNAQVGFMRIRGSLQGVPYILHLSLTFWRVYQGSWRRGEVGEEIRTPLLTIKYQVHNIQFINNTFRVLFVVKIQFNDVIWLNCKISNFVFSIIFCRPEAEINIPISFHEEIISRTTEEKICEIVYDVIAKDNNFHVK